MPLGGLTSIFCTSSATGSGERAPDRPPLWLEAESAEAKVQRFLELSTCLGIANLLKEIENSDKNRGLRKQFSEE